MPTRRQFIAAAGAASLGSVAVVDRARADHAGEQPSHVSITFDQTTLDRYRPRLDLPAASREKLLGLYGWLATSSEFDTDICVYWCEYSHQAGVTSYDSHWGDHEPVYVEVDADTGDVQQVIASVYHWTAGRGLPALDGDHPLLRVIDPWHHYTAADTTGDLLAVKDLTAVFGDWLANGLELDLEPGTVYNPWTMTRRGHWWRDDLFGVSFTASKVAFYRTIGRGTAGAID